MPQRLTYAAVEVIDGMVQSTEHRHMSIRGLALHAQRIGKVFAHPARSRGTQPCGGVRSVPARGAIAERTPRRMNPTMDSARNCSERNCVAPPPECPTPQRGLDAEGDDDRGRLAHRLPLRVDDPQVLIGGTMFIP
jgi:hypothetical protein